MKQGIFFSRWLRPLCDLAMTRGGDRHCERSEAIQPSLLFAAFFSLGLHGLLASFCIPATPKTVGEQIATVEVIWERNNDGLLHHAPTDEKSEKSSITTEKKASKLSKAPTQIKKMAYAPSLPLVSSENDEGKPKVGEENKSHSFKPESKTTTNRKTHHPLPEYPWICRKRRQEGKVFVDVKTNSEGRVLEVNLHKSSGYNRLDEVALEAVKTWTFAEGNQQKVLILAFRLKG